MEEAGEGDWAREGMNKRMISLWKKAVEGD
jgi:hypothetical protein